MTAARPADRRSWAWPLVPLYAAGLAVKDGLRAAGILKVKKLEWPVVSVGSLSAGGAGKTPVVIALAELLRERGWYVDVLSRGYGRAGSGVERVEPDAEDAALRFGDEPVLIAQRSGVRVWVGAERFAAGQAAEGDGSEVQNAGILHSVQNDKLKAGAAGGERRIHLLDDGFQHRGLARSVDIVLVTEQDLQDALLPAGDLREPLRALRRADVVVLREEERERVEARVRGWMSPDATIWMVQRTLEIPSAANVTRESYALLAFCAIARPQGFLETLRTGGVRVADSMAFPDHHRYTAEDMQQLAQRLKSKVADAFVTTEKDAVKLTPQLSAQLEAVAPLVVARLRTTFVDSANVLRDLEGRIR